MKPRTYSWPDGLLLLAAAGGLAFFFAGQRGAGQLEAENARLGQRIAAWENRGAATVADGGPAGRGLKGFAIAGPSGMAKLAAILRGAELGNLAAAREALVLDSQWRTLDPATLERMIADARAADLSEQDRERLIGKLLEALADRDPARAFAVIGEGFAGKTSREIQGELAKHGGLFEKWIKRDGLQALAWLDQQIAAGNFDSRSLAGTSTLRQDYESRIFALTGDGSRITALDPADRLPALQSWRFGDLPPERQAAFAEVARSSGLTPAEVAQALNPLLKRQMQAGDLADADAFFDRVGVTPEELPRLSEDAAGQALFALGKKADELTGEEVPAIRTWLGEKSAEGDSYIGSMIGRGFANGWDAGQIFSTLNQLQEEQPSDDLVSTFLIAASQQGGKQKLDHAAAVELANRIADPGKRAVTLSAIGDR